MQTDSFCFANSLLRNNKLRNCLRWHPEAELTWSVSNSWKTLSVRSAYGERTAYGLLSISCRFNIVYISKICEKICEISRSFENWPVKGNTVRKFCERTRRKIHSFGFTICTKLRNNSRQITSFGFENFLIAKISKFSVLFDLRSVSCFTKGFDRKTFIGIW